MLKNIDAEICFLLWGSCLVYDSFCRTGFVTCPESNTSAVTLVCISEKIYRYKIPLQSYTDSFSEKLCFRNKCVQNKRTNWKRPSGHIAHPTISKKYKQCVQLFHTMIRIIRMQWCNICEFYKVINVRHKELRKVNIWTYG